MTDANLPNKELSLGENTYKVSMLPLGKWEHLLSSLSSTFGVGIVNLVSAQVSSGGSFLDIPNNAIIEVVDTVCNRLSPQKLADIRKTLCSATKLNGSAFDESRQSYHWPRNMQDYLPFLAFALRFQFERFFVGAAKAAEVVSANATQTSE